ncbi:MAG: hypothetical protein Q9227_003092 [Pyrenula ochraceoflavens]
MEKTSHPIDASLLGLLSSDENRMREFIHINTTSLSIALFVVLLTVLYYQAVPKPIPGIPYTQKSRWNPFGDAFDFVKYTKDTGEGWRWFATKAEELQSPVFQVFIAPFSKPIVVVADIQEIIDMATRRVKEFDRGGYVVKWVGTLFPEGTMSMPSHDKFKDQRNIWSSTMTSQFLNTVSAKTIHQHTSSLIELWATKTRRGNERPFEVSDDLKQITFDMSVLAYAALRGLMIWTAATGDDLGLITSRTDAAAATPKPAITGSQDDAVKFDGPAHLPEVVEACEVLVEHLKNMRSSVWLWATKQWIKMTPSWRWAWRTKERVILQLIENSQRRVGESQCAMDEVFARSAQLGATGRSSSSHREMIDETFAYIVGGHETTQDTTKWSMKYLTANQDKQTNLRSALLRLFPGATATNLPTTHQLLTTTDPYIEASVQELIRIALTAPSWARTTTRDVVVLGHHVPKGVDVVGAPSVESLEDMEEFEVDPKLRSASSRPRAAGRWEKGSKGEYRPERWIDEEGVYDGYRGPMLPFGAGPRGCFGIVDFGLSTDGDLEKIGQRLARLELRMMIMMLVISFEFRPIPEKYASFRANEVINRGPEITYIRPLLRT